MPVFFQQQINAATRLAIWKIEETEEFFLADVPLQREVTHPKKRLQHLAGRFLLKYLYPDFPYELIEIADTRKPFLPGEQYHFSISHCGDYAAAIVSKDKMVGVDIELPSEKPARIKDKFLSAEEQEIFNIPCLPKQQRRQEYSTLNSRLPTPDSRLPTPDSRLLTSLWSAKEAVFKWYGEGSVDFREHIFLRSVNQGMIDCQFKKTNQSLQINSHSVGDIVLAWVMS